MPDVAEELMREFENQLAVSTVTEVVIRLSRKGQATLSALTDTAREELRALTTAISSSTASLGGAGAVAPEAGPPRKEHDGRLAG